MVHYKLTYFDGRGAAETTRQVFAVAGVPYEDRRLTDEEWAKHKPKTPFGQMPVLEVDGKELAQSGAIVRYLARQHGLAGKTPFEEALVDALADQFKDYQAEIKPYRYVAVGWEKGDKDKLYKEVAKPAIEKFFGIAKKWLAKSGSGYLVGSGLTYIDLTVSEQVELLRELVPSFDKEYPELVEYAKKIRSHPRLAKWIETRPKTDF